MNQTQKTLLIVGTVLFVVCGLFVPVVSDRPGKHEFLFAAWPRYIDVANLSIRWILIVVTAGVLIYLNRTPRT